MATQREYLIKHYYFIVNFMDFKSEVNFSFSTKEILIKFKTTPTLTTKNRTFKTSLLSEEEVIKRLLSNISLTRISIQFKSVEDKHLNPILSLKKLEELTINGCHSVTDDLINSIENVEKLTYVELYWMPQLKNISKILMKISKSSTNFSYLNLSGCKNINSQCFDLIAPLSKLTFLDLTRCSINDKQISEISKRLRLLKHLNLYAIPYLKCDFLEYLSDSIEFLDLCGNQVVEDKDVLKMKTGKLKYLNLTWCNRLTDVSIEFISNHFNCLYLFSIHGNTNVTQKSLSFLESNRNLKNNIQVLDVYGCSMIETKDSKYLHSLFPSLKSIKHHS